MGTITQTGLRKDIFREWPVSDTILKVLLKPNGCRWGMTSDVLIGIIFSVFLCDFNSYCFVANIYCTSKKFLLFLIDDLYASGKCAMSCQWNGAFIVIHLPKHIIAHFHSTIFATSNSIKCIKSGDYFTFCICLHLSILQLVETWRRQSLWSFFPIFLDDYTILGLAEISTEKHKE